MHFDLSQDEWTKIADGTGDVAVDVRSNSGSFLCSLAVANEEGAVTITMPPAGPGGAWLWDKRTVEPGIAVFARAIDAKAIANVTTVPA